MGIQNGFKFFGVNLKADTDLTDTLKGKRLALEGYGFLHELLEGHFRSDARAASLSSHLWSGRNLDVEGLHTLVGNFVEEMTWFCEFCGGKDRFVVVMEGPPYQAKCDITSTRMTKRKEAHDKGEHRKAAAVPDCAVKLILHALEKASIRYIIPPAEADAQLAFLQVLTALPILTIKIKVANKCLLSRNLYLICAGFRRC